VTRIRSGLRLVPDELDQMIRLARFKAAYPHIVIGDGGFGTIQARIPEPAGETVITRYTLRELLDKLSEVTGGLSCGGHDNYAADRPRAAGQRPAGG
jgi:hypothetical protein